MKTKKSQVNFWRELIKNSKKTPILAMAPMAGITDSAFRQICKSYGAHVLYSEMASVNALVYSPQKTLEMLRFSKIERPYVVQLFGSNSKYFSQAVKIIEKEIKPDGVDINFGCPVPKVAKQGAGAELMADLKKSREIIMSTIQATNLPVSIKIRTKSREVDAISFLKNIQDLNVSALMIHGRTLKQGFTGPIDIDVIKKARKYFSGAILANGGINTFDDAKYVFEKTGADGLGIARGALSRPWIFEEILKNKNINKSKKEIAEIILKHTNLIYKIKSDRGIIEMRKNLCWYVQGMKDARKLREEFVKVENVENIKAMLKKYF